MKFMCVVCWVWIAVSSTIILFRAPISVTYHLGGTDLLLTAIEWLGPFGHDYHSLVTKRSVDLGRLAVALLAVNLLPAFALWHCDAIGEWLRRHKRKVAIVACVLFLLFLLMIGAAMYEKAHRVPPTPSSLDKQSSASEASPSPAPPSEPKPSATPKLDLSKYVPVTPAATPYPAATPQPAPAARTPPPPPSEPARTPPSSGFDLSTAFLVE